MIKTTTEGDAREGDVIETPNGNRYLVLAAGYQAYIGNKDFSCADLEEFVRSHAGSALPVKIVGRVTFFDEAA